MVELVDTRDLKSLGTKYCESSSLSLGTQEKADNLEPDIKTKFLRYPIPKAIVEEWEKVK